MGPTDRPTDDLDRRERDDVLAALHESAVELERMVAALAAAERELDAATEALRRGVAPELRSAVETLLPQLGALAVVLDPDDREIARTPGWAGLPEGVDGAAVAADARRVAPAVVVAGPVRALAVGQASTLVIVLVPGGV